MKNKFLYFVTLFIIIVIGIAIYISVFQRGVDRNSYVELIEGTAQLNDETLKKNERKKLEINDIVTTTSNDAIAIVEWGDGSVTRLGGNTSIQINNLFVSEDKVKLNISFELFKGKTWSTVLSFINEDSYFIQSFMDIEAAVRGTIFNVDLENNYLYVLEHKVELLRESGETFEIEEKKPFDLNTFTFLKLEEFITSVKDTTFENINRALDAELFSLLEEKIREKLQLFTDIAITVIDDNLSAMKKSDLYSSILSKYQELNFSDTDSEDIYVLKVSLKEKLYTLAPDSEKQVWLDSLISDFGGITWEEIKEKLVENEAKIENLLTKYSGGLKDSFAEVAKDLFNNIKDIFKNFGNIIGS